MELILGAALKLLVLAAGGALCAVAGTVAALAANQRLASLALGTTVASAAALALLYFGEPLVAAGLLIAQGGLGVALARHAQRDSQPESCPDETSAGETSSRPWRKWWLLPMAALACILTLALTSATGSPKSVIGFAEYDGFLLAVCALAALVVALGVQALRHDAQDSGQDTA